jgi:integrase
MTIFQDRTTGYWTLKTKADGKDKRIKLRKFTTTEPNQPIPDDVAVMATDRGSVFLSQPFLHTQFSLTIEEFFSQYRLTRKAGSVTRVRMILDHFQGFGTKLSTLQDVTEETIRHFFHWRCKQIDKRLKIKIRPQTAIDEITLLSGLFTWAIKSKSYRGTNPCSEPVKELRSLYPKIETTKYLEPEEVKKFLALLPEIPPDYADLARLQLATGIRVEACVHMEWSWVDMANWTITVPPEWDKLKRGYVACVADLGRQVLQRRACQGTHGRIFPDNITADMSYYHLRKMCEAHKVRTNGSYNHMLRHTLGTHMVDQEVGVLVIMEQLGQKNVKTTMRYAKVRDEAKQKAIKKVEF